MNTGISQTKMKQVYDSSVVHGKLDYLVALVEQYFEEIRKVA